MMSYIRQDSITDSLDFEMLDGMFAQAQVLGYDLLLFTGVYNIHTDRDYNDYHRGLDNIYTFPAVTDLDASILAGDRFKSEKIIHGSLVCWRDHAHLQAR